MPACGSKFATTWRDRMTSYNGEVCKYDGMPVPSTYRNHALAWNKFGMLEAFGDKASYTYTVNGIRTSKTANGKTTKFFLDGSRILRSVIDNEIDIWYNYTVDGIHGITVTKGGKKIEYVFRKNVFGDVTHIYKSSTVDAITQPNLTLAATYRYDAWGKCIVTDVDGSGIGEINPIRYRGYYFDAETKLYYLNARYYDPETGRFISADDTKFLDPNAVNGLNLFAYCNSNPVMNVDPSGRSVIATIALIIAGIVVGTAMGGVTGGLTEMAAGGEFMDGFWGGLANGFISSVGLALGGAIGIVCPPLGMAVAGFFGFVGGMVGGIITEGSKTNWNISNDFWKKELWMKVFPSALLNGVTNLLSFGLGNMMGAGGDATSFLKVFANWSKAGGFTYAAAMAIGFPMFAIGLISTMLLSSN